MLLGLKGKKGAVHFHFSPPLQDELAFFDEEPNAKKQLEALAATIDQRIHRHYQLCPVNYVALDLLQGNQANSAHYSASEYTELTAYFDKKAQQLSGDDQGEGRKYLLQMYANPLLNYLSTLPVS